MSDKSGSPVQLPSQVSAATPASTPARLVTEGQLSIGYPSALPYQIVTPGAGANSTTNPFTLHTKTVNGFGPAVRVVLGPAGSINAWTVLAQVASVAKNGAETLYRMGSAQVTVASTGIAAVVANTSNVGTEADTLGGDAGKMIPSAAIVDGLVVLTFTPYGAINLTIYTGLTGTVARAVPQGVTP